MTGLLLNLTFCFQGHGDNSEFSEILEFFGRAIPNAILPFSCSSRHGRLRSSQSFENLSIVKISEFRVIVFCTIHKNDNSEFFGLWACQPLSYHHSTNYERFIENVFQILKKSILKEIPSYRFLAYTQKR